MSSANELKELLSPSNDATLAEINRQTCERMELARAMSAYANWTEARDLYVKMANMPVVAKMYDDGVYTPEVNRKMLLVIARRKTKG